MRKLRFGRIIKKHTAPTKVIKQGGYFDGPNWIPGEEVEYIADLALFNVGPEEVEYYQGGKYSTQDIKVYAVEGLTAKNVDTGEIEQIELEKEDIIVDQGNTYKIDSQNPRTRHSDFNEYAAVKQVVENDD
ncbi:hypothetical protein [Natroniella sp. ANB-PHB2]|uniref:hypothetical protein n=1 Tax=Natroniella sp. ANB-PHB2 TaxID=3384444 RepID=UPI0038D4E6BB